MKPVPPLIALAEGRRPRARRCQLARPLELVLHRATVDVLRKLCRPEWQWSHFPAGEKRDIRTAARLKLLGLKRGWPDIILLSPDGQFHGLELKRLGENLTEDQEQFRVWAIRHGVSYAVAWSLDEVLAILGAWGAIAKIGGAR